MDESRQRRVKIFQLQIIQFLILNRRKFDLYSRYTKKKMKEDSSR